MIEPFICISAFVILKIGNLTIIYTMQATPDINCAITVASAAPNTPILSTTMKNKSIPILSTADTIRKYNGVLLSPTALNMHDAALYSIGARIPA